MRRRVLIVTIASFAGAAVLSSCTTDEDTGAPVSATTTPVGCPAAFRDEWRQLATRVGAPIYCPGWLPDPLVAEAHHPSVDSDRSYQIGFHDSELRSAETHVVLSGYPGSLTGPRCDNLRGDEDVPCWQKRSGRIRIGGRTVTLYERGLGHEANHLIAAWTEHGSLYAASIHVDPRIGRARAKRDLLLMLHSLERIVPTAAAPSDDGHDD